MKLNGTCFLDAFHKAFEWKPSGRKPSSCFDALASIAGPPRKKKDPPGNDADVALGLCHGVEEEAPGPLPRCQQPLQVGDPLAPLLHLGEPGARGEGLGKRKKRLPSSQMTNNKPKKNKLDSGDTDRIPSRKEPNAMLAFVSF